MEGPEYKGFIIFVSSVKQIVFSYTRELEKLIYRYI